MLQDSPPLVPDSVVFGIQVEDLRGQLQGRFREIIGLHLRSSVSNGPQRSFHYTPALSGCQPGTCTRRFSEALSVLPVQIDPDHPRRVVFHAESGQCCQSIVSRGTHTHVDLMLTVIVSPAFQIWMIDRVQVLRLRTSLRAFLHCLVDTQTCLLPV